MVARKFDRSLCSLAAVAGILAFAGTAWADGPSRPKPLSTYQGQSFDLDKGEKAHVQCLLTEDDQAVTLTIVKGDSRNQVVTQNYKMTDINLCDHILVDDINFDDIPDLLVPIDDELGLANLAYNAYMYRDGGFVQINGFDGYPNVLLDKEHKVIQFSQRNGAGEHILGGIKITETGRIIMSRQVKITTDTNGTHKRIVTVYDNDGSELKTTTKTYASDKEFDDDESAWTLYAD